MFDDQVCGFHKVKVTVLASEWGSSKGGLSTINRELAIQLAKRPEVEITFFYTTMQSRGQEGCLTKQCEDRGGRTTTWH